MSARNAEHAFYERTFVVAALALLAYLLYLILAPFFAPIAWAFFIAFLLHPAQSSLARRLAGRASVSAALLTLVTFLIMGLLALAGSFFLFNEDLNWGGSLMALLTLVAFLAVVATCGVTVSAISNSTVLGIAVLWLALYGVGFALSLLPAPIMTPVRVLENLPNTLRGYYDIAVLGKLIGWSMLSSVGMASIGLVYFSRRDV